MLRLYRPGNIFILIDGVISTTTLLSSQGADSIVFNGGKDPFLITVAIEANSNWIMADWAKF